MLDKPRQIGEKQASSEIAQSRAYQKGDWVRIVSEPWNMFAGDHVRLEKFNPESNSWDFVIPERRGSTPVRMIERRILRGRE